MERKNLEEAVSSARHLAAEMSSSGSEKAYMEALDHLKAAEAALASVKGGRSRRNNKKNKKLRKKTSRR